MLVHWQQLATDMFVEQIRGAYRKLYGDVDKEIGGFVSWCGRLALENIANSDALYHDINHTIMVTLAGLCIVEGKHLREGRVAPRDWMHYMIACICHDIGYVRGICRADTRDVVATGIGDQAFVLPALGSDVSLSPYHVDRAKLFVKERFGGNLLNNMTGRVDVDVIGSYIEMTRFPSPPDEFYKETKSFGALVRAADFVGQLGDPDRLRKTPALFYEFHELGINEKLGYKAPADMRTSYAKFYWEQVSPYIPDALVYLRMTENGKQWIANMHSHVFDSEHGTFNVG